ncbi:hypothetical protein GLW07_17270 [Bacillus hwajinpoensis]|uniref:Uncharacterized protein n=1 Tax=Guptibacillus hwajinpoensis TaxID=208199 RepID=A0A845F2T9_9BACL|nr:hypothetical protein [Pseudalkalibacillus hwajinpoensis]MYL65111.1 hypothetical protein [Pseudalkalibacillus hwajinpoensis]
MGKLYLLLMLPNVVILFVLHKRYINSQFIRMVNLTFFVAVMVVFGYFSIHFPFDLMQQFD